MPLAIMMDFCYVCLNMNFVFQVSAFGHWLLPLHLGHPPLTCDWKANPPESGMSMCQINALNRTRTDG